MFDKQFWSEWGDGAAELAGYDLTFPRYGTPRKGVAVTIFVSETFSRNLRVKSEPGRRPASEEYPVMKLNLIEHYQTGIYNYSDMTSSFVALQPLNGRPAGSLSKVAFSSQEWCGHVFHQLLFDPAKIRSTRHSYFDGEADESRHLDYAGNGMSGDALHHWARGMAWPVLRQGESRTVPFLPSLQTFRQRHTVLAWGEAVLSRAATTERITVPAGTFEVVRLAASIRGLEERVFWVETNAPFRIVRWSSSRGEKAELLASKRLKYWELNAPGGEAVLRELGLAERPPRTP